MGRLVSVSEASKILGVHIKTLQKYDRKNILKSQRTPGGHRRYDIDSLEKFKKGDLSFTENRNCLIYARVSNKKQDTAGNLDRQLARITEYAVKNNYTIINIYKEIASGINENRRQLQKLLKEVKDKNINYLIVEYKDRLARFGFNYIKNFLEAFGVKIVVLNEDNEKDLNNELVEDMISIITSFSARIYGQRGSSKVKKVFKELNKEKVDLSG